MELKGGNWLLGILDLGGYVSTSAQFLEETLSLKAHLLKDLAKGLNQVTLRFSRKPNWRERLSST
jgi:hypothetical protein